MGCNRPPPHDGICLTVDAIVGVPILGSWAISTPKLCTSSPHTNYLDGCTACPSVKTAPSSSECNSHLVILGHVLFALPAHGAQSRSSINSNKP
jgi:hypothetical protein